MYTKCFQFGFGKLCGPLSCHQSVLQSSHPFTPLLVALSLLSRNLSRRPWRFPPLPSSSPHPP